MVVGTRRYRIPPERLRRYVDDLRRGDIHYAVARERLHLLLAEDVRRQREEAGGAPSDAETARVARSAAVRDFVGAVWPAVDPAALVHDLLTDPDRLAAAARGLLDPAEQQLLRWTRPPRSVRAARWSAADAVLVDEVAGLLARPDSYGHVVLDEAQDLSAMQCRGIARRCPTGSVTVLGDLAQGTTAWSTPDWHVTLNHLGKPDARIEPLTRGYRVPADVIAFANRLLPHLAVGLEPATLGPVGGGRPAGPGGARGRGDRGGAGDGGGAGGGGIGRRDRRRRRGRGPVGRGAGRRAGWRTSCSARTAPSRSRPVTTRSLASRRPGARQPGAGDARQGPRVRPRRRGRAGRDRRGRAARAAPALRRADPGGVPAGRGARAAAAGGAVRLTTSLGWPWPG